jgi:hypothetical protein
MRTKTYLAGTRTADDRVHRQRYKNPPLVQADEAWRLVAAYFAVSSITICPTDYAVPTGQGSQPRAARDVPVGMLWAFPDHRSMAEVMLEEEEDREKPPGVAAGRKTAGNDTTSRRRGHPRQDPRLSILPIPVTARIRALSRKSAARSEQLAAR